MTRAAVEDGTGGLGHTLRAGRPLDGGLSFHGVSGLCTSSLADFWAEADLGCQARRLSAYSTRPPRWSGAGSR